MTDQVRTGGLMRCCLETLGDLYNASPERRAAEGEELACRRCGTVMAFREGCWQRDLPWRQGEERR